MFLGLRDRIEFEKIIDYENKLKALNWEMGSNFIILTKQAFL